MKKQTFVISGQLAGCNEYVKACRNHPKSGARMKREQQKTVLWAIKAARLKPVSGCIDVRFTWVEPNMRRDKDNIRFAAKFILDALVEAGIIKNDNWAYIDRLTDEYFINKKEPRIVVELQEKDA